MDAVMVQAIRNIGSEWEKGDKHRVYVNDICDLYGLQCSYYKTGNVSCATLDGEKISNGDARRILARFAGAKLYWDFADERWHGQGLGEDAQEIFTAVKARVSEETTRLRAAMTEAAQADEAVTPDAVPDPVTQVRQEITRAATAQGLTLSRWQTTLNTRGDVRITYAVHRGERPAQARYLREADTVATAVLDEREGSDVRCPAYTALADLRDEFHTAIGA